MVTASKKSAKKAVKKSVKKPVAQKAATAKKAEVSAEVRDEKAILQEQRELQDRLQKVQEEIEQTRVSKAGAIVEDLVAKIQKHGDLFSTAQRNRIQRALGVPSATKKAGGSKESGGTMTPKYLLPGGDAWAGRGRVKSSYLQWEKSAAGKAWKKLKPRTERFPLNPAWVKEQEAK